MVGAYKYYRFSYELHDSDYLPHIGCYAHNVLATVPSNLLGSPHGIMAKVLDCGPEVSEFKLWLLCYVYFQINTLRKGNGEN